MPTKHTLAQRKYDESHRRVYGFRLHNELDKDIIEKLASVPSMQGYIKQLIRDDISVGSPVPVSFTEAVQQYLDRGFVFNTGTMNGLQGELARVDLSKGTCFIRIGLYKNYKLHGNVYELRISTTYNNDGVFTGTIWNDDLKVVYSTEVK